MITLFLGLQIVLGSYGCGFEPFKPLGCSNGQATCICDEKGHCYWVFINCDD